MLSVVASMTLSTWLLVQGVTVIVNLGMSSSLGLTYISYSLIIRTEESYCTITTRSSRHASQRGLNEGKCA